MSNGLKTRLPTAFGKLQEILLAGQRLAAKKGTILSNRASDWGTAGLVEALLVLEAFRSRVRGVKEHRQTGNNETEHDAKEVKHLF